MLRKMRPSFSKGLIFSSIMLQYSHFFGKSGNLKFIRCINHPFHGKKAVAGINRVQRLESFGKFGNDNVIPACLDQSCKV